MITRLFEDENTTIVETLSFFANKDIKGIRIRYGYIFSSRADFLVKSDKNFKFTVILTIKTLNN